jgi:hypothetical protein
MKTTLTLIGVALGWGFVWGLAYVPMSEGDEGGLRHGSQFHSWAWKPPPPAMRDMQIARDMDGSPVLTTTKGEHPYLAPCGIWGALFPFSRRGDDG